MRFSSTDRRGKPRAIWKVRTSPRLGDAVGAPAGDVAAVEDDAAALGRDQAGDAVEQRRLARAVGADEAGDRARLHGEVDAVERADAVEAAVKTADLEQGHAAGDAIIGRAKRAVRARPPQSVRGTGRDGTESDRASPGRSVRQLLPDGHASCLSCDRDTRSPARLLVGRTSSVTATHRRRGRMIEQLTHTVEDPIAGRAGLVSALRHYLDCCSRSRAAAATARLTSTGIGVLPDRVFETLVSRELCSLSLGRVAHSAMRSSPA